MAGSATKSPQNISPSHPNIICLSDDDDDYSNTLDITNVIGSAASMLLSPKQVELPENAQTFSSGFKFWEKGGTLAQPSGADSHEDGADTPPAASKTTFSFNNPENKNKTSFFFNIFPKKF